MDHFVQDELDKLQERGLMIRNDILDNRVSIWINIDTLDKAKSKKLFDQFYAHKEEIENALGDKLDWYRYDDRRYSQIWWDIAAGNVLDYESKWPVLQDEIIQAEKRLFEVIKRYVSP